MYGIWNMDLFVFIHLKFIYWFTVQRKSWTDWKCSHEKVIFILDVQSSSCTASDGLHANTVSSAEPPDANTVSSAEPLDANTVSSAEPPDANTVSSAQLLDANTVSSAEPLDANTVSSAEPPDANTVSSAQLLDANTVFEENIWFETNQIYLYPKLKQCLFAGHFKDRKSQKSSTFIKITKCHIKYIHDHTSQLKHHSETCFNKTNTNWKRKNIFLHLENTERPNQE